MSETERFARSETPMKTPLAGAMFLSGYADLALEADWVPTELEISPLRASLGVGDSMKLAVVLRGEDSGGWLDPALVWSTWQVT